MAKSSTKHAKSSTKQATKHANKASATVTPITDDKTLLAAAFALATAKFDIKPRNVFQAKYSKLDLTKHTGAQLTDRDHAFAKALRNVYNDKPFSHKQTGADTGNMARAIHIGLIKATGKTNADGDALYTAVSNKA